MPSETPILAIFSHFNTGLKFTRGAVTGKSFKQFNVVTGQVATNKQHDISPTLLSLQ